MASQQFNLIVSLIEKLGASEKLELQLVIEDLIERDNQTTVGLVDKLAIELTENGASLQQREQMKVVKD